MLSKYLAFLIFTVASFLTTGELLAHGDVKVAFGDLKGYVVFARADKGRFWPLVIRGAVTSLPVDQPNSYRLPAGLPNNLVSFRLDARG